MARIIHESIAGINLFVPDAYDYFDIDATGMPNGDPCLVINPTGETNPDFRAFAPAPTLSPNIFKQQGAGPYAFSCWVKSTGTSGQSAATLRMGVQTATASGTTAAQEYPLGIFFNTGSNLGVGEIQYNLRGGSSNNQSINGSFTASGLWVFFVVGFNTVGNPGYSYRCVEGQLPPVSFSSHTNRVSGTSAYASDQYFFIGRYADSASGSTCLGRTWRLGKPAFHDGGLSLTQAQMMWDAMMNA